LAIILWTSGVVGANASQEIGARERESIPAIFRYGSRHTRRRKVRVVETILVVKVHVCVATTGTSDSIAHDRISERHEAAAVISRLPQQTYSRAKAKR